MTYLDKERVERVIKAQIKEVRKSHKPSLERSSYILALNWLLIQLNTLAEEV